MRDKIKENKKIIYSILIVTISIFSILISKSSSKYVKKIEDIHAQESPALYFESELADVSGKSYKINNWDISSQNKLEIDIDVENYTNSLLRTGNDVIYTMEAKIIDDASDTVNDEDLISVAIYDETSKEVTGEQQLSSLELSQNRYILNIIPKVDSLESEKEFNIELTISAVYPYTKDLKANITIIVNEEEKYTATLNDSKNGEYVELNLAINNLDNDITIRYDNTKLLLDKSNYLVNDVNIITEENMNSFVIEKEKLASGNYIINFVKQEESITLGTDIICE